MGLMGSLNELDKIDISLYLIYDDVEKIIKEIKIDYGNIFEHISKEEFRKYIRERYRL